MRRRTQFLIVLAIIICCGMFGGFTGYMWALKDLESPSVDFISTLAALSIGILSAGIVPFFLSIISSNIVAEIDENTSVRSYFIFGSMCLLASFHADGFTKKLGGEVLGEATESKERLDELQKVVLTLSKTKTDRKLTIDPTLNLNAMEKQVVDSIAKLKIFELGELKSIENDERILSRTVNDLKSRGLLELVPMDESTLVLPGSNLKSKKIAE